MKILLTFVLFALCCNVIFGQITPTIPYTVPAIPRDPDEWEPPVLFEVPRTSNKTEIETWWKTLRREQQERIIYSGIGLPNVEEYNELIALNNAINKLNHKLNFGESGELSTRIEITQKVNELLNFFTIINSDVEKITTLKTIRSEFQIFACQLSGMKAFLDFVQTSPRPSITYFDSIAQPRIRAYDFPLKVDDPFLISIQTFDPYEFNLEMVWNKYGWQRWYFNYNNISKALDADKNNIEFFVQYKNKVSKWMKNEDIRKTLAKKDYFNKQSSVISDFLPEVYINSNKAINRITNSLKETIPLANQKKTAMLDFLSKEQIVLSKKLQTASDKLIQSKNEYDAANTSVNSLKIKVEDTQKRLEELNKLIIQRQESIMTQQTRIISIQAELEKQIIELDRVRIIKFDCGRMSEEDCLLSKSYLDFELKRLNDMDKAVSKIEELSKEILEIEKLILLNNNDLENYQNELSAKFEEFRTNNEKYTVEYQEMLEKRKNLDVLQGNHQSIETKYNGSLKDSEHLRNANIFVEGFETVSIPKGFEDCS